MLSELSEIQIKEIVTNTTESPSWNISFEKMMDQSVLESKIRQHSMILGSGKYTLTFGKAGLVPLAKITFLKNNNNDQFTYLKVRIRPNPVNVVIMIIAYVFAGFAIFMGIRKDIPEAIFIPVILAVITYAVIIRQFNKDFKIYMEYLEKHLRAKKQD